MRAYIFVEAKPGAAGRLAAEMARISSAAFRVLSVDTVTGLHDIIAIAEARDAEAIGKDLLPRLHQLPGLENTLSCLVLPTGAKSHDEQR